MMLDVVFVKRGCQILSRPHHPFCIAMLQAVCEWGGVSAETIPCSLRSVHMLERVEPC